VQKDDPATASPNAAPAASVAADAPLPLARTRTAERASPAGAHPLAVARRAARDELHETAVNRPHAVEALGEVLREGRALVTAHGVELGEAALGGACEGLAHVTAVVVGRRHEEVRDGAQKRERDLPANVELLGELSQRMQRGPRALAAPVETLVLAPLQDPQTTYQMSWHHFQQLLYYPRVPVVSCAVVPGVGSLHFPSPPAAPSPG
jgi:hypothetical protein